MDLQMTALNRLPCAEPLECRWLLSGAVQALEFGDPTGDNDIEIRASALPAKVVAGLNAGFRRAEIVEASFSDDDGPEFGVTVEFGGQTIEVTLTPGGQIIGTEETISSGALPRPVLDWVRQNFQGAQINNATVANDSGIVSYDVLIVTRAGKKFEATLLVKDERANPPGAADKAADALDDLAASARLSGTELSPPLADAADQAVLLESEPSRNYEMFDPAGQGSGTGSASRSRECESPIAAAGDQTELARPPRESGGTSTDVQTAGILDRQADLVAALQAFAAGAAPIQWLPEVSGLLIDVLPMNVASIERGFGEILDKVESLAEKVVGDAAASSLPSRLAVASVLVAGALLLRDAKKPRAGPVLVYSAANSSWSWVLGASTPK